MMAMKQNGQVLLHSDPQAAEAAIPTHIGNIQATMEQRFTKKEASHSHGKT